MPQKFMSAGKPVVALVVVGLLALAAALEFGGAPGQWARYGRREAGSGGELSFSLKTNISKALVLYLDDGGNCDFLELLIADGRLQLRFAIHCAEPAVIHTETPVNDERWHMVLLTRNYRETMLVVDSEAKVAEVKSKRREMAVVSDLFVGGIPPDVRLSALTSSTVKYEPPFQGLIANLKLGETPPTLLNSQGVQSDLEYLCAKQNPCLNGGLCSIQHGEVHCDCSLTRYKGKYCNEGKREAPTHLYAQKLAFSSSSSSLLRDASESTSEMICSTLQMLFLTDRRGECRARAVLLSLKRRCCIVSPSGPLRCA
ncbi:neurexin-2-like [Arapaima gigas]